MAEEPLALARRVSRPAVQFLPLNLGRSSLHTGRRACYKMALCKTANARPCVQGGERPSPLS